MNRGKEEKTCKILLRSEGFVHLNETITNGGVDSNLLPQSLELLVGHHFHVHSSWAGAAATNVDPLEIWGVLVVGLLLLIVIPLHHLFFVRSVRLFLLSLSLSLCERSKQRKSQCFFGSRRKDKSRKGQKSWIYIKFYLLLMSRTRTMITQEWKKKRTRTIRIFKQR